MICWAAMRAHHEKHDTRLVRWGSAPVSWALNHGRYGGPCQVPIARPVVDKIAAVVPPRAGRVMSPDELKARMAAVHALAAERRSHG
jgi:hypothetical protein